MQAHGGGAAGTAGEGKRRTLNLQGKMKSAMVMRLVAFLKFSSKPFLEVLHDGIVIQSARNTDAHKS